MVGKIAWHQNGIGIAAGDPTDNPPDGHRVCKHPVMGIANDGKANVAGAVKHCFN